LAHSPKRLHRLPSLPPLPLPPLPAAAPAAPAAAAAPAAKEDKAAASAPRTQPQMNLPRVKLSAGMHQIDAQVAYTPEQRQIGLMFRKEMPQHEGMLFVFEQPSQCSASG
jgi:hypothetical protein